MIFNIALIIITICGIILISRIFIGPSLYDRVIAINSFGTISVLLIAIIGFITDRMDFYANGFKIRTNGSDYNGDGQTYIYMAFGQTLVGSNNIPATAF